MIVRMEGRVVGVELGDALVELRVCGVTYAVRVIARDAAELRAAYLDVAENNGAVELLIHSITGDRGTVLYGFIAPADRAAFRRLLRVSRLGPVAAFKILDALTPDEMDVAIAAGDVHRFQGVRGVGEKLAKVICAQLGNANADKRR